MSANAIAALRLGDFKAFADTQRIPIRPLTLIFGDWCHEAIASHNIYPLNGVIASRAIAEDLQGTECRATLVEVSVQSTHHGC